ncbi:enoyl-CoA hydratase/isomerase family protein [bacterium]|nr:enoyl-CoA hydratase/isomerase family protein [bacterium]
MIHLDYRDGIAILRLDHGKVNALDKELIAAFIQKLDEVEASSARSLVITGSGSCFSAGVDLFRIVEGGAAYVEEFLPLLTEILLKLFTYPCPVVAATNGHAIAGGCILVLACDYKIMAKGGGRIGVPELLVGVPFPTLPLEIVRFNAPREHLQELIYKGRNYSPEEALQIGIVDQLVEPEHLLDRACDAANNMGSIPAESFILTKRLIRQPAIDRYQRYQKTIDRKAIEIWSRPEIHQTIREYLHKTLGK